MANKEADYISHYALPRALYALCLAALLACLRGRPPLLRGDETPAKLTGPVRAGEGGLAAPCRGIAPFTLTHLIASRRLGWVWPLSQRIND